MAIRTDNPVTLEHSKAQALTRLLSDYASTLHAQARRHNRRGGSIAVREYCYAKALEVSELEAFIVARLYTWRENAAALAECAKTAQGPLPDPETLTA